MENGVEVFTDKDGKEWVQNDPCAECKNGPTDCGLVPCHPDQEVHLVCRSGFDGWCNRCGRRDEISYFRGGYGYFCDFCEAIVKIDSEARLKALSSQ